MTELLENLSSGSYVLDLGCRDGSFDASLCNARIVSADLEFASVGSSTALRVRCDAARLPFRDRSFAAVVCNHSAEHFEQLDPALREIGRVAALNGSLYVAVPDASSWTDRLYRWLASGGGHVNAFTSESELVQCIENLTRLPHRATRLLHTSLSFLNRRNRRSRPPRKLLLLGWGAESVLLVLTYVLRVADRLFATRTSVYGWAFYFGAEAAIATAPRTNVCIRCGSGHSARWLKAAGAIRRFLFLPYYRCPACSAVNLFTADLS